MLHTSGTSFKCILLNKNTEINIKGSTPKIQLMKSGKLTVKESKVIGNYLEFDKCFIWGSTWKDSTFCKSTRLGKPQKKGMPRDMTPVSVLSQSDERVCIWLDALTYVCMYNVYVCIVTLYVTHWTIFTISYMFHVKFCCTSVLEEKSIMFRVCWWSIYRGW